MAENCAVYVISATVFIVLTLTLMSNAFNERKWTKEEAGRVSEKGKEVRRERERERERERGGTCRIMIFAQGTSASRART